MSSNELEINCRKSRLCIACGQNKELNTLVCWECFKRTELPLKYFEGTFKQWLERLRIAY